MASEDGWEPGHAGPDILEWITVPGTNPPVSLQLMRGWPLAILRAFAADFNAYVEPLRDADSAAFTPTNSVATSNHLNGTAMDLNWNSHRFQISYDGFSAEQIATCRELLDWYEGTIQWGQDWGGNPFDCMHWNMGYNTYNNPHTGDFIHRKIRSDGFSTFRRGGTPTPPTPPAPPQLSKADQYALAVIAEGRRRNISPRGIQIALSVPFVESGWKMYANSNVPESMNIPHDAVGTDHDSVGLFQQRCPMWGPAEVLMDPAKSAGLFYDRLAKMNYDDTSRAPGDYAADVQRPAAKYRGRYQERMGDAVALYNRLVQLTSGDDELSAEAERMIRELYDEYKSNRRSPSRSFFAKDQNWGETPLGFEWNMDGNINELYMTWGYLLGVTSIESAVEFIADNGVAPASWAGSMVDDTGKRWLSEVGQQWCQGLVALRAAMQKAFRGQPAAMTAAPEPQIVYVDRPRIVDNLPTPPVPEPAPTSGGSTGQVIGRAYDALQELRLADALPIEDRAPLAALIAVLQTKNGSELK